MKRLVISWLVLLIVLVPMTGCGTNTEREAIITFTRQALEIEGKRNELMNYFVTAKTELGAFAQRLIVNRCFSLGVKPDTYNYVPLSGFAGMYELQGNLSLLTCPQSLQPIKDTLLYIYNSEIQLHQSQCEIDNIYKRSKDSQLYLSSIPETFIWPEVTKDNIDYWKQMTNTVAIIPHSYYLRKFESKWVNLQLLRRDVYIKWSEILEQYGLDKPVPSGTSAVSPAIISTIDKPEEYYGYLAIYLNALGLGGKNYLTPEENYQKAQSSPLLSMFQIQQRLGAVKGYKLGVIDWVDYALPFVNGKANIKTQSANTLKEILNATQKTRELADLTFEP